MLSCASPYCFVVNRTLEERSNKSDHKSAWGYIKAFPLSFFLISKQSRYQKHINKPEFAVREQVKCKAHQDPCRKSQKLKLRKKKKGRLWKLATNY